MLQDCLNLRNKYVYRDSVAPWYKEEMTDPSTPKPNPDPFHYEQEPASKVIGLYNTLLNICFYCC